MSASHFNFQNHFIQNSLFFGLKFIFEQVIVIWLKLWRKGAVINYVIVIPPLFIKFQLSFCPTPSKWCQRFIKPARLIFFLLDVLKYLGWSIIVTKILVTLLFAIFSYQTLHLGSKLITLFFVTIFRHPPVLNIIFFLFCARGILFR